MEYDKNKIKFKDFIELKRGYDLPTKDRIEGNIPIISSSGVSGKHDIEKVKGPGVVTGRSGLIGSVYYESKDFWPLNTTLYVKNFKGNNPKYVYYFLKTMNLKNFQTGSSVPTLNRNHLDNIEVTIHEKNKQVQQIKVLDNIDKKIENNQKIIANLEELSQTLFKRWFVDFEFPDENGNPYKSNGGEMIDSELGMVPKGWNFEKLKLLIENIKDNIRTKSLSQEDRYVPIDLIPKRKLTFYDYKSSNEAKSSLIKFKKNDILLGSMRVYFHRVSLAPFDGITRNTVFTLRPRDERYLYYLLNAINKDDFIQYAANNSKGSTMPYAVWDGILDEVTVLNPPLQYLIEFNSIVQKYFDISIILLKQNRQLEDLRDTLLPKLMSGEIELPDDIEVNEDELSI
ncbi:MULTISPECIES: restriction endonuclease subunit S [Staphylococcus]|uniref:restriction endonuclease subunit S n=1 Tax=Staphylococcus TaxID=1279 RepID=UPI000E69A453|nr:restriction endonuclease subunit S [Staphylococcus arlettae]RIM60966.1 restriction endonuclease subunit S [Staphylococcus arlettae]